MTAYYNEIDPFAAQWLRNLIARGLIAPGDVDERSITNVRPDDLRGYTQCHFFAGIGGWSYALRLAGWPDDRPVWTGSCPCQPFSAAGKQRGSDDERHLWPAFFDLIRECRPGAVFGEQVAGAAGYAWWDHVAADLEGEGYAAAAADIGAHSVGAPHLRQRLYWVAHSAQVGRGQERPHGRGIGARDGAQRWAAGSEPSGDAGGMADADSQQRGTTQGQPDAGADGRDNAGRGGAVCGVAYADGRHAGTEGLQRSGQHGQQPQDGGTCLMADLPEPRRNEQPERDAGAHGRPAAEPGRLRDAGRVGDAGDEGLQVERGFRGVSRGACGPGQREAAERADALAAWADLEWIECSDGKARPTQPGLFPLAHGIPGRVGRLRAYGNAIVPQVAAVFVMAAMEAA